MKTKSIEWAYPSSSDARKFCAAKSGCWVVCIAKDNGEPVSVSGHESILQALLAADSHSDASYSTKTAERLAEALQLVAEARMRHADPDSGEYNWCEDDPCNWCVRANRVLSAKVWI